MDYVIRFAKLTDKKKILNLYKEVSKEIGGIARVEDEITEKYIYNNLKKAIKNGICLIIDDPKREDEIIGEIHCYKLEPRVFNHIFSELTIVINHKYQKQGLGKLLFNFLLEYIERNRTDVLRVELIVRESNKKALKFYKNLGFKTEGRLEKRIYNGTGKFEADIPMAWFNTKYKKLHTQNIVHLADSAKNE